MLQTALFPGIKPKHLTNIQGLGGFVDTRVQTVRYGVDRILKQIDDELSEFAPMIDSGELPDNIVSILHATEQLFWGVLSMHEVMKEQSDEEYAQSYNSFVSRVEDFARQSRMDTLMQSTEVHNLVPIASSQVISRREVFIGKARSLAARMFMFITALMGGNFGMNAIAVESDPVTLQSTHSVGQVSDTFGIGADGRMADEVPTEKADEASLKLSTTLSSTAEEVIQSTVTGPSNEMFQIRGLFHKMVENPKIITSLPKFQERMRELALTLQNDPSFSFQIYIPGKTYKEWNLKVAKKLIPTQDISEDEASILVTALQRIVLHISHADGQFGEFTKRLVMKRFWVAKKLSTPTMDKQWSEGKSFNWLRASTNPNATTSLGLKINTVDRDAFIAQLEEKIGAKRHRGFDCSSFIGGIIRNMGITFGEIGNSTSIMQHFTYDIRNQAQLARPGDFIYWKGKYGGRHIAVVRSVGEEGLEIVDNSTDKKWVARRYIPFSKFEEKEKLAIATPIFYKQG